MIYAFILGLIGLVYGMLTKSEPFAVMGLILVIITGVAFLNKKDK